MSYQSRSIRLHILFEVSLGDYKQQTDIELAGHPLAERLRDCNSVESVVAILLEQAQDFKEFREKDKVLKSLKKVLIGLNILHSAADFLQDAGLHLPPVIAIQTGLGILLSAAKGVIDDYSALADLLESIGHFLNLLEIYTEIPPTEALNEMIIKILVELLSTLALTTKETKQGKLKKLVRKLVGEKKIEAIVQRLGRLTKDEARQTVAPILKIVHGLIENTKVVMDGGEVSVDNLKESLEIMHQVASDLNKAKRDSLQKDIFGWLSPPDSWKNHHAACESHHRGTAEWFIQGDTFSEWKTSEVPSSLLWVHGKPGAGKSVFCSAIIEDIRAMQKAGLASLAFFYCDFREDRKNELRGLLSSFLVQFYHQSDAYFDILSKFYLEHDKGSRPPSDDALAGCLKDLLKLPGLAPVYLIVDALDECPNPSVVRSPRAKVLSFIEELVTTQIMNLRACVTSRPEHDIKDVLDPLIFRSISLHDESGQKRDIEDYIKSVINTHTTKRWKEEHRKLAIDVLTEKSNGMFRWVDCQAVHIYDCVPARIPQALAELPETLDETYERTLRGIDRANWEVAHRMFQFVSVASRPLYVKELAELLAFDFDAGSIPKYREDWRLKDPASAVLSTCSTLLAIVNDRGSSVIQFSHFSVKEFLVSTRFAKATDIVSRSYHVSMTPAHTLVARACLGILLHLDNDVTSDSLEDFPLAEYAAEHWVDHARFEDVSRNVEVGMKQLFDPSKPHLAIWNWIYDPAPGVSTWDRMTRNETPLPLPQTSLHYAASWGLHHIVEFLIIEHSQDVRSRHSIDNATPLHLASSNGHVKAACKLIERGADLAARNRDGQTPLHFASLKGRVDVARMLIEHGADLRARDRDGQTPLHLVSYWGQVDVSPTLIEPGADPRANNRDGQTPLHLMSYWGQVDVARMLIERGADLTAQNNDGWAPLHLALQMGHGDVARLLIEHGANLTAQNTDGQTPLHLASYWGEADAARMLIERGADLTAKNTDGWTPLHLASYWGQADIARTLIEAGADLNAPERDLRTPLHLTADQGKVAVAKLLLGCGADIDARDKMYETPLHVAAQQGHLDLVRLLLEHNADILALNHDDHTFLDMAWARGHQEIVDINPRYEDGQTALHIAAQHGDPEFMRWLIHREVDPLDPGAEDEDQETPLFPASRNGKLEATRLLLDAGANPNHRDWQEMTPLHGASEKGHVAVTQLLLDRGAAVNAEHVYRWTSLHFASQAGKGKTVEVLLGRGARVDAINDSAWTPLHMVSQKGRLDVVELLLINDADINIQNEDEETALHLAAFYGHLEVAQVLLKNGALLDGKNTEGKTAWDLASKEGHLEIAQLLRQPETPLITRESGGEPVWGQQDDRCVSFIGIIDFSENARWVFLTESVSELLGYEPHELVGTPSFDLVHPDEFRDVKSLHYTTISQDKAAVLAYFRLKHKDPYKGYILCAISRTVAWNVLVGSVSSAIMGPKAMHNASTAQEVTIITPSAANFKFQRWGDPSPIPPSPIQGYDSPGFPSEMDSAPGDLASESSTSRQASDKETPSPTSTRPGGSRIGPDGVITFDPLPRQSIRTALILDRFSMSSPIIYCSNDCFLSTTQIMGRPFFDFVAKRDETLVRSWIDAVKGWGVNERGQPSDGGFGSGKFQLFPRGRDSVERMEPEPPQPQSRSGRNAARSSAGVPHHTPRAPHTAAPVPRSRPHRPRPTTNNSEVEVVVDAIFSAHSDGLMVILRHASPPSGGAQVTNSAASAARPSKAGSPTAASSK